MFLYIFLFMTAIPIAELFIMIKAHQFFAQYYGNDGALLISIGTILFTGFIGAKLMKKQGLGLMKEAQKSLQYGNLPKNALMEGVLVLIGGGLLLTPGYLTDFLGIICLFPLTRKALVLIINKILAKQIKKGNIIINGNIFNNQTHHRNTYHTQTNKDYIDVDSIEINEKNRSL